MARRHIESNGRQETRLCERLMSFAERCAYRRQDERAWEQRCAVAASDGRSRELSWANRLPLSSVGVVVFADRGEPVLGVVELAGDHVLDVRVKRGVRAEDELAQHWHQGTVFAGQRG